MNSLRACKLLDYLCNLLTKECPMNKKNNNSPFRYVRRSTQSGNALSIDIINRFSPLEASNIWWGNVITRNRPIRHLYFHGGPGNPLVGDGTWDIKYYEFIDALSKWNLENPVKARVVHLSPFRCFASILVQEITKKWYFGVMKMHKTIGQTDPLWRIKRSFYAIDSRDYQVVQPS
jgi:hypothetical protein